MEGKAGEPSPLSACARWDETTKRSTVICWGPGTMVLGLRGPEGKDGTEGTAALAAMLCLCQDWRGQVLQRDHNQLPPLLSSEERRTQR